MKEPIDATNLAGIKLLMERERFDAAEPLLQRFLAGSPDHAEAHACLGVCQWRQGETDQARRSLAKAIELDPAYGYPFFILAYMDGEAEDIANAQLRADQALRLQPDDSETHALSAWLHLKQKNYELALRATGRGLAIDPENDSCQNLRSLALTHLGQYESADTASRQTLRTHPEAAAAHVNRGWALFHQGFFDEAKSHFQEGMRIDPDDPWVQRGYIESLKAKNPLYRGYLACWFKFKAFRLFTFFGALAMALIALFALQPPVSWAIAFASYVCVAVLGGLGRPFFNLLVRFSQLLPKQERFASDVLVGFAFFTGVCAVLDIMTRQHSYLVAAGTAAVLGVVVANIILAIQHPRRDALLLCALLVLGIGVVAIFQVNRGNVNAVSKCVGGIGITLVVFMGMLVLRYVDPRHKDNTQAQ